MAYDLLEFEGQDLRREQPLKKRQEKLAVLLKNYKCSESPLLLSEVYRFENWEAVRTEEAKQPKNEARV